jgi:uncharacterized protein YcbK (DUF882 family)
VLLLGSQALQNAVANGDTRTISFRHLHTGEQLTITYKRDGRYDDDALKKINHVMRDWRRNEEVRMDPHLIDIVWEVNREVGGKEAIEIICGYRAPATNSMLRRRSKGVAQFSQHTLGRAIDFHIPGASLEAQRIAGLRLQRGGVGYYPSSGSPFVHLDVGSVRHWPRMTHDQLARVFPNGRTVHVPSDGRPLAGYALALADVQRRGGTPSQMSLDAAQTAGVETTARPKQSLLAALFRGKDEDDDAETASALAKRPGTPAKVADGRKSKQRDAEPRQSTFALASIPLPSARPLFREVARTATVGAATVDTRPLSPSEVIAQRGYWRGLPDDVEAKPRERIRTAAVVPAPRLKADDEGNSASDVTASIAPWPVRREDAADRVPPEFALAYAAADAPRSSRAREADRAGRFDEDAVDESAVTVVKKSFSRLPGVKTPTIVPAHAVADGNIAADPGDDPWLRAALVAPSLRTAMTTTLYGVPDFAQLSPLMEKPATTVVMTFTDDPHHGMTPERFAGGAVVFLSTVTFVGRQAALR